MNRRELAAAAALTLVSGSIAPVLGAEPDPKTVLNEAQKLARQGKYEEALKKHIWFHENALRLDPAMTGVRLSFALSYWVELGKKYPKARASLVAIRDKDAKAFQDGGGTAKLFSDVAAINRSLEEEPKTVALFKRIDGGKAELAQRCYLFAEQYLAGAGEYQLCGKYISDPGERFERTKMNMNRPVARPQLKEALDKIADQDTCRLIEILVGAGRKPEAEAIQKQAVAVRDTPAIRDAIATAEKEVQRKTSGKPKP